MSDAPAPDLNQLTKVHIKIRDARATLKKEYDAKDGELKASIKMIEAALLDHLNRTGSESVRTEAGTFFTQESLTPSCADWSALYAWIAEHDAWDVLERRVKSSFVKEFAEAHDGSLPPGISVFREKVVRVRRGN